MIVIKSPRYHDRVVLVARYKLTCGQDATIKILYGAYKGIYKAKHQDIVNSPIEGLETKQGKMIAVRAIPLDVLERIGD